MGCAASSSSAASPSIEAEATLRKVQQELQPAGKQLQPLQQPQKAPASRESNPSSRPSSPLGAEYLPGSFGVHYDGDASPLQPLLSAREEMDHKPAAVDKPVVLKEASAPSAGSADIAAAPADVACAILGFCGWADRVALMGMNKHWRDNVFGDDTSWKAMCSFLHREECVYSTQSICVAASWKQLFAELWPLRSRWVKAEPEADKVVYSAAELLTRERAGETGLTILPGWKKKTEEYSFNISVVVRMRPQRDTSSAEDEQVEDVVLPLHQRLALIRKQKSCSKEEAFQHLFGTSGGDFFDGATVAEEGSDGAAAAAASAVPSAGSPEPTAAADSTAEKEPLPPNTAAGVVSVDPKEIVMCAPGVGLRPFTCFNSVLSDSASQAAVYETVARRQVADFINGLNCTIFCYGQTGSGKTHTLFGKDTDAATTLVKITTDAGVVPRACAEVASAVALRGQWMDACELQLSYVEVYGEDVSDLLKGDKKSVGAWRGTAVRAVLDGTTRVTVKDAEHMQALLLQGEGAKRRAATAMNSRSSRAHALLILSLKQNSGGVESESHLCLADLGGSEQLSKSGATGVRMQEAIGINTGLLALKQCIRALNNKAQHVPYHDSKLTELLSSALGGNSKTTVVVTASPESRHASESLQALRFGEACAVVTNEADAQQSSVAHLIAELDAKISTTEATIEKNERWERWEEQMPVDEFGDGGGIRTRMKLVGAEKERAFLEECLKKRRALLGEPEPDAAAEAAKKADAEAKAAGRPDFEQLPEGTDALAQSEAAFRDQFDKSSANHHGGDDTPAVAGSATTEAEGATVEEAEAQEETPQQKKVRLMAEKQKARMEKAQKVKEERRAAAVAKAAEREKRAAKRKAEMLEATKEKARKQQERMKRQMDMQRRAREQRGTHLEEELAQVEAKLAESIKASGADSAGSVALAEQAEKVRQEIKRVQSGQDNSIGAAQSAQEEMAIFSRSSRLASHGFASDADGWQTDLEQREGEAAGGGRSSLSEEELALIQQHRQGQALVSDQALKVARKLSPEPDATAAGEKPSSPAAEGGSRTEVAGTCGRVAGAVATGWQAVTPLEEASNKMLPAASGGGMPEISEQ
jgi:hypothetical protein